jgi:hypothetical protein
MSKRKKYDFSPIRIETYFQPDFQSVLSSDQFSIYNVMIHTFSNVLLSVLITLVVSTSYTWIGANTGGTGLWSTATNWSPNGPPSDGDVLTFSQGNPSICDVVIQQHTIIVQDSSTITLTMQGAIASFTTTGVFSPKLMCNFTTPNTTLIITNMTIGANDTTFTDCLISAQYTIQQPLTLIRSQLFPPNNSMLPCPTSYILAQIRGGMSSGLSSNLHSVIKCVVEISKPVPVDVPVTIIAPSDLQISASATFNLPVSMNGVISERGSPIFQDTFTIPGSTAETLGSVSKVVNYGTPRFLGGIVIGGVLEQRSGESFIFTCPITIATPITQSNPATITIFNDTTFVESVTFVSCKLDVQSDGINFNGTFVWQSNGKYGNFNQGNNSIAFNGGNSTFLDSVAFTGPISGLSPITFGGLGVVLTCLSNVTVTNNLFVNGGAAVSVGSGSGFMHGGLLQMDKAATLTCDGTCILARGFVDGAVFGSGTIWINDAFTIRGSMNNTISLNVQGQGVLLLSTSSTSLSNSITTQGNGSFISTVSLTYFSPVLISGTGISEIQFGTSIFKSLVTIDGGSLIHSGRALILVEGMVITLKGGILEQNVGTLGGGSISVLAGTIAIGKGSRDVFNPIQITGLGTLYCFGTLTFHGKVDIGGHSLSVVNSGLPTFSALTITSALFTPNAIFVSNATISGVVAGTGLITVLAGGVLTVQSNATIVNPIAIVGPGYLSITGSPTFRGSVSTIGLGISSNVGSPRFLDSVNIGVGTMFSNSGYLYFQGVVNVKGILQQDSGSIFGGGNIIIVDSMGSMKVGAQSGVIANPINMTMNTLDCAVTTTPFTSFITSVNICLTGGNCLERSVCANCSNGFLPCQLTCFGELPTSPKVCSGFGRCIAQDRCACLPGYTQPKCQYPICYGPRQTIQKCVPAMVGVFHQTNATVTVDGQVGRVLSQFVSIILQTKQVSAQEMGSATFLTCVLVILDGTGQNAISLIAMVAYQLMMVFAIGRVDALDQINAIALITL